MTSANWLILSTQIPLRQACESILPMSRCDCKRAPEHEQTLSDILIPARLWTRIRMFIGGLHRDGFNSRNVESIVL